MAVQRSKVLIVDDDLDIRVSLAELLEVQGYAVSVANSGQSALEHLRSTEAPPQVILLDLMMPIMDGWQFRAEQQKNADWAKIPILLISASGKALERAETIGAVGCFRKPFDLGELLLVMSRLCQTCS
jgi:CheY-like chemotaxis protein